MSTNTSQPQPEQPPQGTVASGIREAAGLGRWMTSLTTPQFQALVLGFMTLFVCALTGWIVYRDDVTKQADKARVDRQIELLIRENNYREENLQKHCSLMMRDGDARSEKFNKEMFALFAAEREKDRQHNTELERERLKTLMQIQSAWAAFATKFADLEKLLRAKLPPDDLIIEP